MVRASKVDIPNPFNNNEYKPIFLSSTEETSVINKNDLTRRISEIEKNLEAVETLLNDNRSIIVDDDNVHRSKSFSSASKRAQQEDMRYKILELKRRLSSQKSISDIKSETELSSSGKLRHYRSASIISDRIERQSKFSLDHNDYVYGNSKYSAPMYSESNLDLLSLPGFRYEYTQKDQELKSNINALRDRLIRKRISDTALSLKAYPSISSPVSRNNSTSRVSPEPENGAVASKKKRLSIIEDSYEKLISTDGTRKSIQSGELDTKLSATGATGNADSTASLRNRRLSNTNGSRNQLTSEDDKKNPRRSLSYGYLRYSQYTSRSPIPSPTETSFSMFTGRNTIGGSFSVANNNSTKKLGHRASSINGQLDSSSNKKVLRMVKSIESMNGNLPSPKFVNNKLVDKEKLAKLAESREKSEKRVELLRKRLTAENYGTQSESADGGNYNNNNNNNYNNRSGKATESIAEKELQEADPHLTQQQSATKTKIDDLKRQVSLKKSGRKSTHAITYSPILDPNFSTQRPLSRTGQYLRKVAEKEQMRSLKALKGDNISGTAYENSSEYASTEATKDSFMDADNDEDGNDDDEGVNGAEKVTSPISFGYPNGRLPANNADSYSNSNDSHNSYPLDNPPSAPITEPIPELSETERSPGHSNRSRTVTNASITIATDSLANSNIVASNSSRSRSQSQSQPQSQSKSHSQSQSQSQSQPRTSESTSVSSYHSPSSTTHHEYAYTKPDLESVAQNLTYRKSAFADSLSNDNEQQQQKQDSNINKLTIYDEVGENINDFLNSNINGDSTDVGIISKTNVNDTTRIIGKNDDVSSYEGFGNDELNDNEGLVNSSILGFSGRDKAEARRAKASAKLKVTSESKISASSPSHNDSNDLYDQQSNPSFSTDDIEDLAPSEVLVNEVLTSNSSSNIKGSASNSKINNNGNGRSKGATDLGRKISIKGYKSHGKSHSISSNFSILEKFKQADTIREKENFSTNNSPHSARSPPGRLVSNATTTAANTNGSVIYNSDIDIENDLQNNHSRQGYNDKCNDEENGNFDTINGGAGMDDDGPTFLRYDFSRGAPGGIHEEDNNSISREIRDVFSSTAGSVIEKMDEQSRSRLQSRLSSRRSYNVLKQSIVEADYSEPPRNNGADNGKHHRNKHNNNRDKNSNHENDDEDIIVSGGGIHTGNAKGMLSSSQAREVKYKVRPRKQKPTTRFFKRLVNMFKRNGSGNNHAV